MKKPLYFVDLCHRAGERAVRFPSARHAPTSPPSAPHSKERLTQYAASEPHRRGCVQLSDPPWLTLSSLSGQEAASVRPNPELDVERLFKKSIKRDSRASGLWFSHRYTLIPPSRERNELAQVNQCLCFFFTKSIYQTSTCVMDRPERGARWGRGAVLYPGWTHRLGRAGGAFSTI